MAGQLPNLQAGLKPLLITLIVSALSQLGQVESLLVMVLRLPAFIAPQVPSLKAHVVFDFAVVQEELLQYGLPFTCYIIYPDPAASTCLRPRGGVGAVPTVLSTLTRIRCESSSRVLCPAGAQGIQLSQP